MQQSFMVELHLPGGMSIAARMIQEPMSAPSGVTPRFYRPADASATSRATGPASHVSAYSASSARSNHASAPSSSSSSSHSIAHRK